MKTTLKRDKLNISIKLIADMLYYDSWDPSSKNIRYRLDIFNERGEEDEELIGRIDLTDISSNLMNLSEFDLEVFDAIDGFESNANLSIIDIENLEINQDCLPQDIVENIQFCYSLFLLHVRNIVIKNEYRGLGVTQYVFKILKTVFRNHLFILKPFPLQHCKVNNNKNYDFLYSLQTDSVSIGIKKLISTYHKLGFRCLNSKQKEPYMVMLNN